MAQDKTETKKPVRLDKVSRAMTRRTVRLLDMEYKISEIADELQVPKAHIQKIIDAGAPLRKDTKGHIWIHGLTFAHWLQNEAPRTDKDKKIFSSDEAYCLTCKKIVKYTETRIIKNVSYGKCPEGHKVTRFVRKKD